MNDNAIIDPIELRSIKQRIAEDASLWGMNASASAIARWTGKDQEWAKQARHELEREGFIVEDVPNPYFLRFDQAWYEKTTGLITAYDAIAAARAARIGFGTRLLLARDLLRMLGQAVNRVDPLDVHTIANHILLLMYDIAGLDLIKVRRNALQRQAYFCAWVSRTPVEKHDELEATCKQLVACVEQRSRSAQLEVFRLRALSLDTEPQKIMVYN